jgi:ABC-type multidrug transport system fused ATPase/permease subunit
MKLTYGKQDLSFKYYYLIPILLLLLTEGIFYDLVYGEPVEGAEFIEGPAKMILALGFVFSFFTINSLSTFMRNYFVVCALFMFCCMLESYYVYGTFFKYPHVFAKIMDTFVIFAVYPFFKENAEKKLAIIIYALLIGFFLDLVIYKNEILSFSAFVETERGFSAPSTFFIMLICLYFFNVYLQDKKVFHLVMFFVMLGFILFLQHRSVWLSFIFALVINLILVNKSTLNVHLGSFAPFVFIPLITGFLVFTMVLSTKPEVLQKLGERISDIQNVESQGTGSWRLEQFKSYMPYMLDNPLLGMRMKGFELPIQFYHPEAGVPYFDDGTGHHFHSFYVDRLFYFGLIGISIMLVPFIYLIYIVIKKSSFSTVELVLISYSLSALVYGVMYNFEVSVFAILGITISVVNNKFVEKEVPQPYVVHSNSRI